MTLAAKVKKTQSMEREISLRNILDLQKSKIIESFSGNGNNKPTQVRPSLGISRTVSSHRRKPGNQPDIEILKETLRKVENLIYISHQLREDAREIMEVFHMDNELGSISFDCQEQIEDLVSNFRDIKLRLSTKVSHAPNIYLVRQLPADIWLKIFSYLSVQDLGRVAQVSSFWRHISQDGKSANQNQRNQDILKKNQNI